VKKRNQTKRPERGKAHTTPGALTLVLDVHELAQALRVSPWTARRLVSLGEIPALSLPAVDYDVRRRHRGKRMKRVLVSVADAEAYIERMRKGA